MIILPIQGEATRFHVESNTLQCTNSWCGSLFPKNKFKDIKVGQRCPVCVERVMASFPDSEDTVEEAAKQVGTIDVRFHLVDIARFNVNGECSCEYFQMHLKQQLNKLLPAAQAKGLHRCSHIELARQKALDLTIAAHEQHRGRKEDE